MVRLTLHDTFRAWLDKQVGQAVERRKRVGLNGRDKVVLEDPTHDASTVGSASAQTAA